MTSLHDTRWLQLDGTANTRDLGGLPTTDGGRTLPNRILRSDNLQTLTDEDVERLVGEIGLRQVIDLRTSAEVLLEGRGPLRARPEVVHRHFTLLPERGEYTDVFAAEAPEVPDLPSGWLESVLPRGIAEGDQDEPPAVRIYLGYLADRGDAVVAALRAALSASRTEAAPGSREAPIEPVWTCSASCGMPVTGGHSMANSYSAAPSSPSVAWAVEVDSRSKLDIVTSTPSSVSRSRMRSPRASLPRCVASTAVCPSRARPTATLSGLPPTCSVTSPSSAWTTSMSASPMTSVVRVFGWDMRLLVGA